MQNAATSAEIRQESAICGKTRHIAAHRGNPVGAAFVLSQKEM